MDRPTFSTALNSDLPRVLGLCAQDRSKVARYVNRSQEELITDPLAPEEGWWGGYVHMLFNVPVTNFTGSITTPREIARVDVMDICTRPRFIRNGFYEYLMFGTGHKPRPCNPVCGGITQAFERDNVPTLIDFPTTVPQQIRIYASNAADAGKIVQVQGTDQNGNVVYSTDNITGQALIGEQVILKLPFAMTAFSYQTITGLLKDPTVGPVTIFTVDASGNQTQLSAMEPGETTASYRRYFLNNLPPQCCSTPTGQVQIDAQCKLDFVPVVNDSDYLIIQSVPALIAQCQSIKWSTIDAAQASAKEAMFHKKAISILCGQIDHFEGKTKTAISLKIFGSDRLRPQPI
jgi:hypothetical protein